MTYKDDGIIDEKEMREHLYNKLTQYGFAVTHEEVVLICGLIVDYMISCGVRDLSDEEEI